MPVTLVTGANRGLGLGLTRHLLELGHEVIGACRRPEDAADLHALPVLGVVPLDLADDASIEALPEQVRALTDCVDVLVNNAGVKRFQLTLAEVTAEALAAAYRTNVIGPLLVTRALLPLLAEGAPVVNISSKLGSLAESVGTDYGYNASKAALNMVTLTTVRDLGGRVTPVSVNPGWVRTSMGGDGAPLDVDDAMASLAEVVDGLGPADAGRFLDHEGRERAW